MTHLQKLAEISERNLPLTARAGMSSGGSARYRANPRGRQLGGWLSPFVERFGHKARRRMCPLYVAGLIGLGDRKSVGPPPSASSVTRGFTSTAASRPRSSAPATKRCL